MSNHLPECPLPHCDYGTPNAKCYGYEYCPHYCFCAELRACEQRVLNLVRADERKRAVFIAQHSIEDHYARDDAIAWINGETPKWWTGNQP